MMRRVLLFVLSMIIISGCDENTPPQAATESQPATQPVINVTTGKNIADKCADCHAQDGMGSRPGVPFLAGQQVKYLENAMKGYKYGDRQHDDMKSAIDPLTELDMADAANYYGELSSPWKGSMTQSNPVKTNNVKEAIAAGKAASTSCNSCHGIDGNSVRAGVPSLAGLPSEYFITALKAYFSGQRNDTIMKVFKDALNDKEINHLAAYYASLTPKKTTASSKGHTAGKKIAAKTCAGCHGIDGNSSNPTIPGLAGQNAEYLYTAIKAYRNGQRTNDMMKAVAAKLSDKTIHNLVAYFTQQNPSKPTTGTASTENIFDPVTEGKRIAGNCNGCHGENGNSNTPGIPSLNRLHTDYLMSTIKAYQKDQRKNATMKSMVSFLSDEDIEKVSLYYATQQPKSAATPGKGNKSDGEKISAACSGCHGEHGNSTDPKIPTLAGQDAKYIANAIASYANKARNNADMQNAIKDLGKQNIMDVATYYASQTAEQPKIRIPEAPEVLAQKCDRCHGEAGHSTDPNKPRLAGQVESYLAKAIDDYQTGVRKNSAMHAMTGILSNLEITAIAKYYASQ